MLYVFCVTMQLAVDGNYKISHTFPVAHVAEIITALQKTSGCY
jgi:hypothetical protein